MFTDRGVSVTVTLSVLIMLFCGVMAQADAVPASVGSLSEPASEMDLTMGEAIRMAVDNPLNLGPAEAGVAEAQAGLDKAQAGRMPSGSVSGSYTRLDEGMATPVGIDFATGEFLTEAGSPDIYSTTLTLQWPIYTGGKITSGIELAKKGLDSARLEYDQKRADTTYQAIGGYIGLLKANGFVQLSQEYVNTIAEHLKLVETNYQLGYATRSDLLETKIRLSQAEQGLVKAKHGQRLAQESLKNLLGLGSSVELKLADLADFTSDMLFPKLEEAINTALALRPELRSLDLATEMARESLEMAEGYWKPTVALVGTYGTQGSELKFANGSWKLTAAAEWKFFDGGAGRAGVDQAQAGLDKLEHSLAQARNGISLEVRQKYLALTEAQEARSLATLTHQQALENYEFTQAKYELEAATNLELLTAQNTLNQAANDELNAEYDYYLAVVDLYRAMGQIEKLSLGVDQNA